MIAAEVQVRAQFCVIVSDRECRVIMWYYLRLIELVQILLLFISPIYGQYRNGDVRLVGGSYQWEGRVQIYFSGTWGTITDSEWTDNDAQVVCRKLGHFKPGATAHSNAYFGEGRGTIHLDSVECSGSEYNLTDCETENSRTNNGHSLDVGVKCQPANGTYREGDIRLVGGPHDWEGRVEIFWMGSWGTISDSSWTVEDAIVVCRQLQHSSGSGVPISCCDVYGEGTGDTHIRDVMCVGSEESITSCGYLNNTVPISHQNDVRVQCQQGNEAKEGDIRLIGSSDFVRRRIFGRVEIFLSGVWGTVSEYGSNNNDARVVCRQLGYNTYDVGYRCCAGFGEGSGPVHFTNPQCTGVEHRLSDCQYDNNTQRLRHNSDWGVYCYIDGPEQGDARLMYGYDGVVEVFLSGRWIHVANTLSTWTQNNSNVVCRELGYQGDMYWYASSYDNVDYDQVDNVICTGTEAKLRDCSSDVNQVDSDTAVEMYCYDSCNSGDMRLADGGSEAEGRVEICSYNRNWGTVCDNQWTENHTAVVCRHFGFSDIIGDSTSERFGRGTGPILMDYVNCTGSEPRIWDECTYFTHYYGCNHDNDVGVRCKPASCSDGQLRLIEGSSDYEGRVEICSNQRWETLDDNEWFRPTARVVCIELGFLTTSIYYLQYGYGRGGGPLHSKYYQCGETDQRLSQCSSYNNTRFRTHSSDVGTLCLPDECLDGELRLVDGKTEYEGRLEVCFSGRWGTVGSEGWSQVNSDVVCNALGYDTTDGEVDDSIPVVLSKPVYLHNIRCTSSDLTLLECGFTRYASDTKMGQDATTKCQQPTCKDGDIKLVGGASEFEGRLEICFGQRWTTIDGDGWTHTDTEVACSQLGLSTSDVSYTKTERERYTGGQTLPVSMTLVGCYSSDERIIDCAYHDFPSTTPTLTSMDISISCQGSSDDNEIAQLRSVSTASLTLAVIFAIVVIILIAVLIVMFILRQRRKRYDPSVHRNTELTSHHATHGHDSESGNRYSTSKLTTTTGNQSLDDKKMDLEEDVPMDSYEEVAAPNDLPLPPKPQPKKAPKKPTVAKIVDSKRYKKPSAPKPAVARPPMRPHHPGRVQQQPRPPSPEAIYEDVDC